MGEGDAGGVAPLQGEAPPPLRPQAAPGREDQEAEEAGGGCRGRGRRGPEGGRAAQLRPAGEEAQRQPRQEAVAVQTTAKCDSRFSFKLEGMVKSFLGKGISLIRHQNNQINNILILQSHQTHFQN